MGLLTMKPSRTLTLYIVMYTLHLYSVLLQSHASMHYPSLPSLLSWPDEQELFLPGQFPDSTVLWHPSNTLCFHPQNSTILPDTVTDMLVNRNNHTYIFESIPLCLHTGIHTDLELR